ncbi:MAG: amidohydrolase [Pyrinomonadaceae bacterium]|nr:amidohydrolase [Pyrinomonadaceae bacterium]
MKRPFLILVILISSLSSSTVNVSPKFIQETASPTQTAKLFINGKIYTVNEQQEWAEAVYVDKDGVIRFVGTNENAREASTVDAEVIDLKGKMMMPGIHDVHQHPLEARSPFAGTCQLYTEETNAENYIELLKECKYDQLASNWVLGAGHSVFTLLESSRLPVNILDEAIPDKPAAMMGETSHSVWVNSKAFELAGIDKDTPNPQGGVIVKDKRTGRPTGVLFDAAGDLIMDLAWLPTDEIKELNYKGLLAGLKELNKNGITSVCEGRTYWKRDFQNAWLRAENENRLTVRAVLGLWAYPHEDDEKQIAKIKSLYRKREDSLLRISQVKAYSDGILINSTAAMLKPYKETIGDIPSNNGLNYFSEERLAKYIAELEPAGFDFHIHALGDRAARESLNAIEKAQKGKGRHRLTHLEVVDPSDFERFKLLNVTADMQVAGDFTKPEHWRESEFLIGARAKNLVPLKSLFERGARITLSSDWDVSYINPFIGMENALTRAPQNLPNLKSVIEAYTINSAYVMRQEEQTGSIEVGKYADLIVIDQNLFDIEPDKISKTKVLMTFLAGKRVY